MNKKALFKYAIEQVTQYESEPQAIATTHIIGTLYSKARATTLTGYNFTPTFYEKKVHCCQVSNRNKNGLDHESFNQSNIERLLHLSHDDCKNKLRRLKIFRYSYKGTNRKLLSFQVFSDTVHQSELERFQGHIKLDDKHPYHGAHGIYVIFDTSNCKADTKNKEVNPDKIIKNFEIFTIKKINWHVFNSTPKQNLHVNTSNYFTKHNFRKLSSITNKVSTWIQVNDSSYNKQHILTTTVLQLTTKICTSQYIF